MAKLQRYLQKIFANNSNQVGVFGTGVNKETSKNVETLQSADYKIGWSAAIVTNKNYPIWQERDGVDYGFSYQLAYLMQQGIPEWLSTETYYTTSYCQYNGGIYRSKVNNNIGKVPVANVSNDYWQFLGRDFLNTQQITNCLLEVPQRIKYTLVDGTLTILAGSVILVPYGTTDQSSTYTVGSTFINSNLKVVDRVWDSTNNRFFVWAELQSDLIRNSSSGGAVAERRAVVQFTANSMNLGNFSTATSVSSDSDAPNTCVFYNTTTNLVKSKSSGTLNNYIIAFPVMITKSSATYSIDSIKQVFNGFGFIGSVIWADKDINGVKPNGRNADGTLKNTQFSTTYAIIRDMSDLADGPKILYLGASGFSRWAVLSCYYDAVNNYNMSSSNSVISSAQIGEFIISSGTITKARFDNALNINSLCDGQWVHSTTTIASDVTYPTTIDTVYSLADYLPNDGYAYEVIISGLVATGTTSGNYVLLSIASDIITNGMFVCSARTRTSSLVDSHGTVIIPVGTDRNIIVVAGSAFVGTYSIYLRGYRRVGTNA